MYASILATISIIISSIALFISYFKYKEDSHKITLSYNIRNDGIEVIIINIGKRPAYIKSVGIFDWQEGHCIIGENKVINEIINEAESICVIEPYTLKNIWRIKYLFAVDQNNKQWRTTIHQMEELYQIAHPKITEGQDYVTCIVKHHWYDRFIKSYDSKREISQTAYRKFAKKNNYTPRI